MVPTSTCDSTATARRCISRKPELTPGSRCVVPICTIPCAAALGQPVEGQMGALAAHSGVCMPGRCDGGNAEVVQILLAAQADVKQAPPSRFWN